jgi:chaperone required for assembly of F1-ATPase
MTARRFYKTASAVDLRVLLDERTLRTPAGHVFEAPTAELASHVADEWRSQGETIVPASMPLTQLAFAALDGGVGARVERTAYVLKFAATDLCCHRAASPAELVARQEALWGALVAWGEEALGVRLPVVTGIVAAAADLADLSPLRARVEALDDFRLVGLAQATGLSGSALIGFALLEKRLDADAAFAAAALDDLWSLERWGEDEEAREKLDRLKRDLSAVGKFIDALSG